MLEAIAVCIEFVQYHSQEVGIASVAVGTRLVTWYLDRVLPRVGGW